MPNNTMTHLPQGWEVKKLGEIGFFIRGVSYKKEQLLSTKNENSVYLLRANNIQNELNLDELQIIPKELVVDKIIQNNDILFAMSSGSKHIVGKNILLNNLNDFTFGAFCGLFRIINLNICHKFIAYYLRSDSYKNYIFNISKGSNINNLRFIDLEKFQIPLPPLKEQGRIAGILDLAFEKIDKSVELLKANLANLDELAQSVLDRAFNPLGDSVDSTESTQNPSTHDTQSPYPLPQHWEWKTLGEMCKILNGGTPDTKNPVFWDLNQSHEVQTDKSVVGVGGEVERGEGATSQFKPLHPLAKDIEAKNDDCNSTPLSQDDNSPYPLPQHWEWKTLGEIGEIITGSTPSKNNPKFYGNDYPLFKPSDLGSGNTIKASDNLSKLGFENARKLPKNTLLVVCIGASIGKIGLSGIIGSCNQQINAIIPSPNVLSKYLFFVCHSKYFQSILKKNASQTTLPIINKTEFSKLEIPLPKDIKEQEQIAMHLDSVFGKIQKLKELYNAQLQDYEELKQSLLTQAFSGKL